MRTQSRIVWLVVLALLGSSGCSRGRLNEGARARLDTVGVVTAQYRPVTIVPPAPANYVTALGQYSLHYGHQVGSWSTVPLLFAGQGGPAFAPLVVAGVGLSIAGTTVGATYGSIYSLFHRPDDSTRARQATSDLRSCVDAIDFQQRLASTFLAEAAASSPHRFEFLPGIGPEFLSRNEPLQTPLLPVARLDPNVVTLVSRPVDHEQTPYHRLKPEAVQSILELRLERVQFIGTEEHLTLVLRGQALLLMPRFRSQVPDFRPVEALALNYYSEPAPYREWSADDGRRLQEALDEGGRSLAQAALKRWFQ